MNGRVPAIVGFALSLGMALALTWFGPGPKATLDQRLVGEALWWGAAAALLVYLLLIERRPLSAAGLRPLHLRDTVAALVGTGVLILGTVVIYLGLFPVLILSISLSHVPNIFEMPWWYRAIMILRIAVVGELLFRAAPIERADTLGPAGKWIGAAVSLAGFIAVTWSGWNPVESIAAAFAGVVLTALYLWKRNAGVNMIARALALGVGYLLR